MFGLPNKHPLSEVVLDLTRDHFRCVGDLSGMEPPLLRLLEIAIKADTSGASGGSGRNKNSAPLDVTALALWEDIALVVGNHWPGKGNLDLKTTHLIDRLEWWTNTIAGTPNEVHLMEYCKFWHTSIRNLLEPPKRVPLRGSPCPACKETWLREEAPGETVMVPVLTAYLSETPMRVSCYACEQSFNELGLRILVG